MVISHCTLNSTHAPKCMERVPPPQRLNERSQISAILSMPRLS